MAQPGDTVFIVQPINEMQNESERKAYSDFDNDQSNIERWLFWLFGD